MVNAPAFAAGTAKEFLGNLKLLAATTDKAEGAKKALSALNRGVEAVIEAFGLKSGLVSTMGGQPETHILGETFYTQVPLLYGDYIAKVCVAPVAPDLTALTGAKVDLAGKPNGLREAVQDCFAAHGGEWEVRVQLCTDLDAMPIEKASKVWPEDKSPYLPVARITVEPQNSWSPEAVREIDEGLAFGPCTASRRTARWDRSCAPARRRMTSRRSSAQPATAAPSTCRAADKPRDTPHSYSVTMTLLAETPCFCISMAAAIRSSPCPATWGVGRAAYRFSASACGRKSA